MPEIMKCDLCIIGAGSGGLTVAAGAAQMGAKVVLIEHSKMGGDCLNYGCVPSKALLAAAHAAETMRRSDRFGITPVEPDVDYAKVQQHVHRVQAAIALNDSIERFTGLGVNVISGHGQFINAKQVSCNEQIIEAKYFVIASGASAATPDIAGLDQIPCLTNETIFTLAQQPTRLIVIGGGPIGAEMAQAHAQLGIAVTQLVVGEILPKDDRTMVASVRTALIENGIELVEQVDNIVEVKQENDEIVVTYAHQDKQQLARGSHLLLAAGRQANVDGLNLEAAGIEYSKRGIGVDRRLRTSNRKVFAIGDVTGPFQFTHMATYQAGIVIRNTLFKLPAKVDYHAVPWVTYTAPEMAHVGMQEAQALAQNRKCRILSMEFTDNDRAQTERQTTGKIKVITNHKGIIIGCDIVAAHAGELILPWVLAVQEKMAIGKVANLIAPYPTLGEISKRVAGSYYTPILFSERTKKIVKWLNRWF
ncbi:MAG: FAD-dependent oxidoreductase [Gammaproteobacteria bacterium]|nr:FAD-dependent oxidoreductase [Gammaproteobacteria bacterium]